MGGVLQAKSGRYALSFTSGALLVREALVAAPAYLQDRDRDWAQVRTSIAEGNLLQARTIATGLRRAREVTQRLQVLTDPEIEFLVEATPSERGYLMWVAACRRYAFIGDFAEEVLRERFLVLGHTVGHDDFDAFMRRKALWHEELTELSESTVRKLRSTIFRMMIEAGLLTDAGVILQAVISERAMQFFENDLSFLPTGGVA